MGLQMSESLIERIETFTDAMYEADETLSGSKEKRLKLVGTAIVCDRPGINGRSYPSRIIKKEMNRYITKYIRGGRSFAELNHPRLSGEGEGKDYSVFEINLMKACCMIESLSFNGADMICKMKVIEKHPAGAALKALVDDGLRPGYSLRGAGSVIESGKGYYEVDEDYRMITIDVVGNPSFDDDAIVDSLYESIKEGKVNVLTESVQGCLESFNKEFMLNVGRAAQQKIMVGRKKANRDALVTYFESISNIRG